MRYPIQGYTQYKRRKFTLLTILLLGLSLIHSRISKDANDEQSISSREAKQISDINMLLPVSSCDDCRRVTYQISAINGCYNWEVSHPNLIEITKIPSKADPECSNIANVKAISTKSSSSLIWISARDKHSGQVLRCEVKLGKIQRLEIQTHLRQFYLNDYEHLSIAAYDELGNIFSGLEGLRFEWNIDSGTDKVKIVSWKEAAHTSSDLAKEFEFSKMQSDVLFLKGINQGTAVVSVKIMEPSYESVEKSLVSLSITEPFVVVPQTTVYLAPTCKYQFNLAKVTLNNSDMSFSPISLPNKQYQWNIEEQGLGFIGDDGIFISQDKEGLAQIYVVDQFIANNTAEGSVKVVFPQMLDVEIFDVTPQITEQNILLIDDANISYQKQLNITMWENNWILVESHFYLLKVYLYDRDKNQIQISNNMVFSNIFDPEYFEVINISKVKNEIVVKARKPTIKNQRITFTSVLDSIKSDVQKLTYNVDSNRLRAEKEVQITEPVQINHPTDLILLPLLKNSAESGEIWQVTAKGGSGYFHWSILDNSIATITGAGLARSVDIGITTIVVRDSQNQRNLHTIQIEVTPITSFQWLEDHIEVKSNTEQTTLSLMAFDKNGRKFTNCTSADVTFDLKGAGILAPINTAKNFSEIKEYVSNNIKLIELKQQFDLHPSANFISEISPKSIQQDVTPDKEAFYVHNNFGICTQQKYLAVGEGLARVKAHFINQLSLGSSQVLETQFSEVAVYHSLVCKNPSYNDFFSDLYSKNQQLKDDANFERFIKQNQFILAFGTSLQWFVQGGTNFWKDIPEKYQSQIAIELTEDEQGPKDNKLLTFEKISDQTTQFQYQLQCLMPSSKLHYLRQHEFSVTLNQHNQISRTLLRPATHSISIIVICEPPQSVKLYWAQESKQLLQYQMNRLPSYVIYNQEKHHYVLSNSVHFIRSLLLDQQGFAFFNHSSVLTQIQSTNDSMTKVSLVAETYQDAVAQNQYDLRKIEIFNKSGTVYVNAHTRGYYKKSMWANDYNPSEIESLNLPFEIKDQFRLEVVRNVDIQPKFKSIYLSKDNTYSFKIMHGSGHFSVSINNTDIAEKQYIDGERTIIITPKKEGPIEIRVEDIEIPDSAISISELLISDVAKLEVDSPGTLIEEGSQMELNITAIDCYNNPFDDDQYQYMLFTIEIESTQHRERGLFTEADPSNNRRFIAKGYESGNYQVTAISLKQRQQGRTEQERHRVSSEVLKIEVFPLLEIYPSSLLLTPLMRYTLQIVGGPSRSVSTQTYHGGAVVITFKVENESFATVDQFREVTGQEVGDTNLFYEITQIKPGKGQDQESRKSIVSKKTIPIKVRLVTDIEIPFNDQRTVYSGSMIKMFAILKFNEETFSHGIAPISYGWNCSNSNILTLNLPNQTKTGTQLAISNLAVSNKNIRDNDANNNNAVFLTPFNSSTIYTTGGKQGEAIVTLQLAIEYPSLYKNNKNWFTTTASVKVKDKLKVDIPEFINNPEKQTHLYLMPPNSYSKIETNRRTRLRLGYSQQSVFDYSTNSYQFKDVQTPIISLVNEEGIRTLDKYGKVTVIIEEKEAFSDQVIMLNVLITDIYSIAAKDVYQTLSFPLGSQMNIQIKFQNEHGHQFANNIEGVEVGIELSHPRVVSASLDYFNQSISMKAEGSGECNVLVYLVKHPHIYDIFRVRVSSVVMPYSPVQVHVGGQIKFKIMDHSNFQSSGETIIWGANSPSIIEINPRTGEAKALQEGDSEIRLSNNINAASIVHVSKVKIAEVDQQSRKNLIINADDNSGEVRIRLKLFLKDQIEELTPSVSYEGITLIQQNVGLLCENDIPNIITTGADINDLEGFFCVIKFKGNSQSAIPKSASIRVSVFAQNPRDPSSFLYKDTLLAFELTFLSKIRVESHFRNGINLYSNHRTTTVRIYSNTQFSTHIENINEQDRGYELVKFGVNKTSDDGQEYILTVKVPQEITHNFNSEVVLTHPATQAKTIIPINFQGRIGNANTQIKSTDDRLEQREVSPRGPSSYKQEKKGNWLLYSVIILVVTAFFGFIVANQFGKDPQELLMDILNCRSPFRDRNQQAPRRNNLVGNMPPQFSVKQPNYQAFVPSHKNISQRSPGPGAARQPAPQSQPTNLSQFDQTGSGGKRQHVSSMAQSYDYR